MSISFLLLATRDVLRTQLAAAQTNISDINDYVGIQPQGIPPAACGRWYVSLDEGGVQSDNTNFLRERYTVRVWITWRTGDLPKDRRGKAYQIYATNQEGMDSLERQVIGILHANETVRLTADTYVGAPGAGGDIYTQPLFYQPGRSTTDYRGNDWILGGKDSDSCMVRQLTFEGADRIQALDVMLGSVLAPSGLTATPA
jgi:hypothetical protein